MSTPVGMSPSPSGTSTPLLGGFGSGASTPTGAPFLPTRVLDSRRRHKLAVERHYQGRWYNTTRYYLSDPFHTLVNIPWYRFYTIFVLAYIGMYCAFAAFYVSQPGCITLVDNFWHALWFSVESSATIGYGHQAPDPDCYLLQTGVMVQVLTSLLFQGMFLGIVFARISNASGRSATIRFSNVMSMYRAPDGLWRLAFRVANMRQHQVLQPEVRMLLLRRQAAHAFSSCHWEFVYSELPAEHIGGGRLWLGVPSIIEHRVDAASPLYEMNEADMRAADIEIIVLLDGIDESTSRAIQARRSYVPADIRWQVHFDPCIQRRRSGKIGVDFSLFDATQRRGSSAPPDEAAVAEASGSAAAGPAPGPSNGGGSPLAAPPSAALPSNKWPRGRLGEQRQQQEDGALPLGSPFESESYLARKSPSLPPV